MGGLAIVIDRKAKPIRWGDLMAYGLFELAQRRASGIKPSMVIVRFSKSLPSHNWWDFIDLAPEIVLLPNDKETADDLFPLSGLDVLMYAMEITNQVEHVLQSVQQLANCITFISDSIDDGGFCWHRAKGEKLLGERYAMAA